MRHLLTLLDLTRDDVETIFDLSSRLKGLWERGERPALLPGRVLALLFSKPSLRTRVSFEAGMAHLGGQTLYLGQDVGFGSREPLPDFARVLSQFADVVVCRTFHHHEVEQLAHYATCPVINGLTDRYHPCQALADVFTLQELRGSLKNAKVVFVGDGNNVSRSLAVCCAHFGMPFALACPAGYEFDAPFLKRLEEKFPKVKLEVVRDPQAAVRNAAVVYTDVWSSMGQEAETELRRQAFADYQVNAQLMQQAPSDAIFMHCLPAKRGEEVTSEVLDGPQSQVVPQAGNRMHVQKGVLAWLLDVAGQVPR